MKFKCSNQSRFSVTKFFCAALVGLAALSATPTFAQQNNQQTGVAEVTLLAKGDAWISVKADDAKEAVKLMPVWIGGLPRNGGGLDKRMLAVFRELVLGSRLKVAWLRDEHMRVTNIEVLPKRDAGNGETEGNENGGGQNGENPEQPRAGETRGVVTAKGEDWISIRADGDKESTKLLPRWIGKAPKDGGGFDKQMVQTIAQTPVGARVRVEWVFQEHLRVVVLKRVE